ncbi:MAG: hypothetical protein GWP08_02775 [Nitrospiraceae bacterium]|nr:hypothetical protein [Nitrospiraceae bacterium]
MEFFDANCRIGSGVRTAPAGIACAGRLLETMDAFGIDRALVHGTEAATYDPVTGNEALMLEVGGCGRLVPSWVAPAPDARGPLPPTSFVEDALTAGVRALRVFPGPGQYNYPLSPWVCGDLLSAMAAHRMPLLFEALARPWDEIHALARSYPELPLVCLRPKFLEARIIYALLDSLPSFHFTFSYFAVHRCIEDICHRYGPERLLFDTGLPEFSPAIPIGMLMYAGIGDEKKAQIAHGNLDRLLEGVR